MLNKLTELFTKFPGIGPRQAKRFAYFLAEKDEAYLKTLSQSIIDVKKEVKQCDDCRRYFSGALGGSAAKCPICANLNRDTSLLMIVEKDVDLENIEKSGVYDGKYFVLGGMISLTSSKTNVHELRLAELFNKVKNEKPKEIILALSTGIEGENTNRYIEKILEPVATETKITRLGRGLSTGAELEYSDSDTLKSAMENRK